MINVTEEADVHLSSIISENDFAAIKLAVKGGGCAGYEYILDFGESTKRDLTFVSEGLPIVIDKKSHIVINKNDAGEISNFSTNAQHYCKLGSHSAYALIEGRCGTPLYIKL